MTIHGDLARLFTEYKERKFLLVMPGGNHGDYLIYFGLDRLAAGLGIDFDVADEQQLAQMDLDAYGVIYLHGSGGYNKWSSGAAERILQHALRAKVDLVIQGPCSVSQNGAYLETLFEQLREFSPERVVFYSREQTTYRLVIEFSDSLGFGSGLNFDTALFARKTDIEREFGPCKEYYRLYSLREDGEKAAVEVHDFGVGVTLDPARYCKSFAHWVKVHSHAREIITTRTHSAVIGAILGKKTTLYPSNYHKNRSIWEYSLRDMGVLWGPDTVDKPVRTDTSRRLIPRKIRRSYKLKQAVLWAHKVPLI